MKNISKIILTLLTFALIACNNISKKGSNNKPSETSLGEERNNLEKQKSIISGRIVNRSIYPHIKELKLTIPDFDGNKRVFISELPESGEFRFEIFPITKREISLTSVEDILVIAPGDSLYIEKDFKDIGKPTIFSGDRAQLNSELIKFREEYLGRYPTNYQQDYLKFKEYCITKKAEDYQRLLEFQRKNKISDEFNTWAIKQIELDFSKALFHYYFEHFIRTKQKFTDADVYFSFIGELDNKVDNSIIMSDYFKLSESLVQYKIRKFRSDNNYQAVLNDSTVSLIIKEEFSSTNSFLNQFSLCSFLNISLRSNKTNWIDNNIGLIETKINDPFLKKNLKEHYDRVAEFNENPKRFSNALLEDENIEINNQLSLNSDFKKNIVRSIIETNPGKVIFVDFWATWCPPCIYYMGYSKKLMEYFAGKEVEFVFICINSREDLWDQKIKELNLGGNHYYCNSEETRAIRKRFGFSGVPYYMLINKEGEIVDFGLHLVPISDFAKQEIEKLINE